MMQNPLPLLPRAAVLAFLGLILLSSTSSAFRTNTARTSLLGINKNRVKQQKSRAWLAKGFGSTGSADVNTAKGAGGFGKSTNKQIKDINDGAMCPCGSGKAYESCCKALHTSTDSRVRFADPEAITRARYTAYAMGLPSYLIDSTHSSHSVYKRHMDGSLDEKKARKAWEKEILTQNSEIFEFLKLEMISPDEPFEETEEHRKIDSNNRAISFRVLVRKRDNQSLITFQETSVYVPRAADHAVLGGKADKKGSQVAANAEASAGNSNGWLYSYGIVTPVPEEIAKRIKESAPKYQPDATIRDRW